MYFNYAYAQLIYGRFTQAEPLIRRGLTLDSTNVDLISNLLYLHLFQDKYNAQMVEAAYLKWKDKPFDAPDTPTFKDAFLYNFDLFEKGDTVPKSRKALFKHIKAVLKQKNY